MTDTGMYPMQTFKMNKLLLALFLLITTVTLSSCNSTMSNTGPNTTAEEGYGGGGH